MFIYFLIDLDDKLLISSFPDIGVETYLPNEKWRGVFDNPIKYLPENII